MKRGNINDKEHGGDRGALRDPHRDRSEGAGGLRERQVAGTVSEERADPLNQIRANPLFAEEREERGRLHVVEASFHIEEEGGDLVVEAVKGFNMVL